MYRDGIAVEKDEEKAAEYFSKYEDEDDWD